MMGLAAGRQYVRVSDLDPVQAVARHTVGLAVQLTAKVGQLHGFILQGAVGKQQYRVCAGGLHSLIL
ncbi:hypothetical protein D3C71_2191840 [compost metagenome]